MAKLYLFLLFLFTTTNVIAISEDDMQVHSTTIHNREVDTEKNAALFNVTQTEWKLYQSIMDGEGRYHWKDVDPIVVLGIYAKTEEDRTRFARIAAKKEHELNRKFIAFNQSYLSVFDQLYGHENIIDLSRQQFLSNAMAINGKSNRNSSVGDRYVLFVSTRCSQCESYFKSLRNNQKIATSLDIYFINDDKQDIGNWAKKMDIKPSDVAEGKITLNLDNGMYASYKRPSLPAAYYFDKQTQSIEQLSR